jgi:hypothetical protein
VSVPDLLAKQIADAVIARVATISGIGNTGIEPREPQQVDTFPAVFVMGDQENKTPVTMSGTGGSKESVLDLVLSFYVKDVAPMTALYALSKSIQDVIQAAPYGLGVTGVYRPFVTEIQRYRATPPLSEQIGIGYMTVQVKYHEQYGTS